MNAETWQRLKTVFHAAVELAPHDREAFLKANSANNDELHSGRPFKSPFGKLEKKDNFEPVSRRA